MFKFLELINTTHRTELRKLGVFIYIALELTNEIVILRISVHYVMVCLVI